MDAGRTLTPTDQRHDGAYLIMLLRLLTVHVPRLCSARKVDGGSHISRRGAVSWFFHHHQNTKRITLPFSLGFRCYVGVLMMAPVFPGCHREFPCPRRWFAVVCSAW